MKQLPKLPKPVVPTEEQMKDPYRRWMEPLAPCLWTNWPEPFKKLTSPVTVVPITRDEIDGMLAGADRGNVDGVAISLEARLNEALKQFGDRGAFYKLGSRSPKDLWGLDGPKPVKTGRHIIDTLCGSMRTFDDLCIWRYADEGDPNGPHLLLKDFVYLPPSDEFRCFIRDGKVAGVSQYLYDRFFEEYEGEGHRRRRRQQVLAYLDESILPHLPVPNLVVDVCLIGQKPYLIELNPYGQSDPCLFTYADLETADRELRVATQNVVRTKE